MNSFSRTSLQFEINSQKLQNKNRFDNYILRSSIYESQNNSKKLIDEIFNDSFMLPSKKNQGELTSSKIKKYKNKDILYQFHDLDQKVTIF